MNYPVDLTAREVNKTNTESVAALYRLFDPQSKDTTNLLNVSKYIPVATVSAVPWLMRSVVTLSK